MSDAAVRTRYFGRADVAFTHADNGPWRASWQRWAAARPDVWTVDFHLADEPVPAVVDCAGNLVIVGQQPDAAAPY